MASEDNVVRLKHLQALAQTVADEIADITLQGGGSAANLPYNADFALYVPNDTSIIVTGKQQPVLSLGSWSVADSIYSAAITYDGDGELSVNVGSISDGVLTVADDDGIFNGILSASEGDTAAPAALNFNFNTASKKVEMPAELQLWHRFNDDFFYFARNPSAHVTIGTISLSATNAIEGNAATFATKSAIVTRLPITFGETDFTFDFYAKFNSTSGYMKLFRVNNDYKATSPTGMSLVAAPSSNPNKIYVANNASWGSNILSNTFSYSTRHHFAIVFQRNSNTILIFIDGQLSVSGTWNITSIANPYILVGSHADEFVGSIDEFRFWTKALWTEDFTPPTAQDYIDLADGISLF